MWVAIPKFNFFFRFFLCFQTQKCLYTPCIKHQQNCETDLRTLVTGKPKLSSKEPQHLGEIFTTSLAKTSWWILCSQIMCKASWKKKNQTKNSFLSEHLLQVLKLCLFLNAATWASMHSNLVLPLYQVTHSVWALLLSACRQHYFCKWAAPSSLHSFRAVSSSCSIGNHSFHALMHYTSYRKCKESNSSVWQFQNARNKGTLLELKHTPKAKWPLASHQVFCSR